MLLDYDAEVEKQINQQQQAIMAVQQAIVNARKAEQDTLTVEQQGKAKAAEAKWAQEVTKATEVTSAEKDKAVAVMRATKEKEVAALDLETAKLQAQTTVTKAKADSDAAKLAVQANNNFEARMNAYVETQKAWATAYGAQKQVSDITFGVGGGGGTTSAMDIIALKAARDLQVTPHP
jgi:membrane protein involved in colicin uptake